MGFKFKNKQGVSNSNDIALSDNAEGISTSRFINVAVANFKYNTTDQNVAQAKNKPSDKITLRDIIDVLKDEQDMPHIAENWWVETNLKPIDKSSNEQSVYGQHQWKQVQLQKFIQNEEGGVVNLVTEIRFDSSELKGAAVDNKEEATLIIDIIEQPDAGFINLSGSTRILKFNLSTKDYMSLIENKKGRGGQYHKIWGIVYTLVGNNANVSWELTYKKQTIVWKSAGSASSSVNLQKNLKIEENQKNQKNLKLHSQSLKASQNQSTLPEEHIQQQTKTGRKPKYLSLQTINL